MGNDQVTLRDLMELQEKVYKEVTKIKVQVAYISGIVAAVVSIVGQLIAASLK
ncbi:MAG: hypothetical protein KDE62_05525 [Calditrichaeota bacterium]|nr:hypothetical protein [Calditrichota bacterium]